MIYRWTMVDEATGAVINTGSTSNRNDIPIPLPGVVRVDGVYIKSKDEFVKDGKIEARPSLDIPAKIECNVGQTIGLEVPAGAKVFKNRMLLGEASGKINFTPTTAGQTEIRIEPPFPTKPVTVTITAGRAMLDQQKADKIEARAAAARADFSGLQPIERVVRGR